MSMRDVFLVNYSVKGIKTLDEMVSLSFYKKIISKDTDTQEYNIKGIYGMNGSGKSGIVISVDILRNLLINVEYLNNPIVQKKLDAMINKRIRELYIEVDYITKLKDILNFYRYKVKLTKNMVGKYVISYEQLSFKKANSKKEHLQTIFEIQDGEIVSIMGSDSDELAQTIEQKTVNLLDNISVCALFCEKIMPMIKGKNKMFLTTLAEDLSVLFLFGKKLHVYLDQSDEHKDYFGQNKYKNYEILVETNSGIDYFVRFLNELARDSLDVISISENIVPKNSYEHFEECIRKLYEFLHIFKSDLRSIEIDKKEDYDAYICSLILVYDDYKIHAEFESTGIKKLIRMYAYLREMVEGGIVFVDEFDSNLHDVYLCALLEYLMEYGEGQLCFTTHNVGPMDVLKTRKKSIDFLSEEHKIYSWTTNGNYSPSKLYRNGMIEGSPFNVDSIDFVGVFDSGEEGV